MRQVITAVAIVAGATTASALALISVAQEIEQGKQTQQLVANGFIGLLGAALGNDRGARNAQR